MESDSSCPYAQHATAGHTAPVTAVPTLRVQCRYRSHKCAPDVAWRVLSSCQTISCDVSEPAGGPGHGSKVLSLGHGLVNRQGAPAVTSRSLAANTAVTCRTPLAEK